MSFKKSDKKGKKPSSRNNLSTSPPSASAATASPGTGSLPTHGAAMPNGTRAKLLELFGQIEQQFEAMHTENIACKPLLI